MTKMSSTVGEFAFMKDDLTRRLSSLENPKVDRIGGLESQSRAMAKQVCVCVIEREGETERGREREREGHAALGGLSRSCALWQNGCVCV